jgi:short-chain fatty acids transporter
MNRLTAMIVRFSERWMPDAFAVAIALTLLTLAMALALTPTTPMSVVAAWGDGFWSLIAFTNEIALTLLLGHALASTAPVRAMLLRAAGIVRSTRSAYVVVCMLTDVLALLSWSRALVAAGTTSRAVAEACRKRGIRTPRSASS